MTIQLMSERSGYSVPVLTARIKWLINSFSYKYNKLPAKYDYSDLIYEIIKDGSNFKKCECLINAVNCNKDYASQLIDDLFETAQKSIQKGLKK